MRRARTERPENFEVDLSHPLMRGAVLLGLGQAHHSIRYRDESGAGRHGVLTGYTGAGNTPADMWCRAMGRACVKTNGTSDIVTLGTALADAASVTVAAWMYFNAAMSSNTKVFTCGTENTSPWLFAGANGDLYWANHIASGTTARLLGHPVGHWDHYCGTTSPQALYVNGILQTDSVSQGFSTEAGAKFGGRGTSQFVAGRFADTCIWTRALDAGEIRVLADSATVMLSGAIREPRPRRNFAGWRPSVGVRYGGALRAGCSGGEGVRRGGAMRGA